MKKCEDCGCEIYSYINKDGECKGKDCLNCSVKLCKDCCDADSQKWEDFENGGDPFILDDIDF
jgi:hypothetical protein